MSEATINAQHRAAAGVCAVPSVRRCALHVSFRTSAHSERFCCFYCPSVICTVNISFSFTPSSQLNFEDTTYLKYFLACRQRQRVYFSTILFSTSSTHHKQFCCLLLVRLSARARDPTAVSFHGRVLASTLVFHRRLDGTYQGPMPIGADGRSVSRDTGYCTADLDYGIWEMRFHNFHYRRNSRGDRWPCCMQDLATNPSTCYRVGRTMHRGRYRGDTSSHRPQLPAASSACATKGACSGDHVCRKLRVTCVTHV